MKNYSLLFLAFLFSRIGFAADIETTDWIDLNKKILNETSDLSAQSQVLLTHLIPNADLIPPHVGEAVFTDIDKDGELELVIRVDYSGRGFFTNIVVVQKKQGKFTWSEVKGNGVTVTDLRSHLVDVDGDGILELIKDSFRGQYQGAKPVPIETQVYGWRGNHFSDASDITILDIIVCLQYRPALQNRR